MRHYDIAIIGLGPAGAFLAQHLHRDFSIIAIDKKQEVGSESAASFRKPCGGLLAPDAQKVLSRFHMTLPVNLLVNPQIFSVRTIDVKSQLVRYYQRHYINLDRHKLDLWFKSLIPSHVDVHHNANCTKIAALKDGGYEIRFTSNGEETTIHASTLVGADGANSLVRRTLLPPLNTRTYICVQQRFLDAHPVPFYSCVFDENSTDCYAWGLTKENQFIFGGAFPVKDGMKRFEALKTKLTPFGFRLDEPLGTEACLTLRPKGLRSFCCGNNDVHLIGEAAGFISPSSLEGISYALESGYALATAINGSKNTARAYKKATRKLRIKLFGKTLKSPFMYQPLLRRMVMRSGLNSIKTAPMPQNTN